MKLIFCVDKQGGMMFFGKRQSSDSVLRERLLEIAAETKLFCSSYTAKQFSGGVIADDNYMDNAFENDYCFIEDGGYDINAASEVILCHWNRRYQADVFFTEDLTAAGFKKVSTENIVGSSHDKITIETYKRG